MATQTATSLLRPANTSTKLNAIKGLQHGFFGRQGGVSQGPYASLNIGYALGDDDAQVQNNWATIAASLHIAPAQMARIEQVHGRNLIHVDVDNLSQIHLQEADAMLTTRAGIALGIRTADCVPLLFADAKGPVIAATHAGWRGLATGIIEVTIQAMLAEGTDLQNIRVAIGPHIGPCCYEVGEEVCKALGPESRVERQGQLFADMSSIAIKQLRQAGLDKRQIDLCNPCVSCEDKNFFSHRRDMGITGRQLSVIVRA